MEAFVAATVICAPISDADLPSSPLPAADPPICAVNPDVSSTQTFTNVPAPAAGSIPTPPNKASGGPFRHVIGGDSDDCWRTTAQALFAQTPQTGKGNRFDGSLACECRVSHIHKSNWLQRRNILGGAGRKSRGVARNRHACSAQCRGPSVGGVEIAAVCCFDWNRQNRRDGKESWCRGRDALLRWARGRGGRDNFSFASLCGDAPPHRGQVPVHRASRA